MMASSPAAQEKTAAAPMLSIRNLSVSYPRYGQERLQVLRGIEFSIGAGEVVALVGESGSGKTMLARAIMRLIPAPGSIDTGRVEFDGRELGALRDEDLRRLRGREIAMVVSNPRGELDPLETIGQQIGSVLRHHLSLNARELRERVLQLLSDVRIPDVKRRYRAYPHELSGGMAQRVVMAIALACAPKFVISDDATSGLDVTVQAQVLDLLKSLVENSGASTLFITRDIGVAAHFADRIAVIYRGQIVEEAPCVEFFDNPCHPYTVLLLAAFAQNRQLRRHWIKGAQRSSAFDSPAAGCIFRDRCVRAKPRCALESPALRALKTGHTVRCHYPVER